ncbi:GrpB-like predicted nucleotidyltransferase (UPF0157 family) [Rhizobium sp. BK313]|jgi:GrpB-like predicted nucleotidyltransferase (UPF0157 family)|uniref:GrpB family protein n=1 Tax=Rhizobium sp. BK313 TaxID=2587081 RepID=UPI00105FA6ED|nr:GrpB family protein [Rhizobium sp. BK313]MBB3452229.1 GrpB-like predicted nucleotidyltransferase (UPF0157 family) [Rhizobium sp. BK313]
MTASNPVELVPYDPDWPVAFTRIREKLEGLLRPYVVTIEHVGSTSIPGLAAKPLLDIDIVLRGLDDVPAATQILLARNYEPRGNRYDDDVWAFMLRDGTPPERIYICPPDNLTHQRRIIFRDHLRSHPEAAAAYAALKQDLAAKFRYDGDRYTASKRAFVDTIIDRALR